jgi:hypothetical protein
MGNVGGQMRSKIPAATWEHEDEVNPAMSVAIENGLSVTALHNHFLFDHPAQQF